MTTFGNDILGFNRDFNIKVVYYNNILRNAGRRGLTKKELVTTSSIKLCGPAQLDLDLVLHLRASNNAEQIARLQPIRLGRVLLRLKVLLYRQQEIP
jgi:hypothetical protein